MKSSDELGSSLTTLMQMRYATEAMIIGGTFICVSKAAEQEGCSQYLQNTLRQGGLFIASLSMLMLALAWRSEMVAAFAHLADWARRRRPVRAMSALGFVLIVAALVSGVAARFHGGPYPLQIILPAALAAILLFAARFHGRRHRRPPDDGCQ